METYQAFDHALLDRAGLNRQAVFNIDDLPADVAASVRAAGTRGTAYRQLILIGHAGKKLWESVNAAGIKSQHPIDDFSIETVKRWFAQHHAQDAYEIIYPGEHLIGLQRLGQLAGWHHASPLMVGIDNEWGTWFAYRAVALANTNFAPSMPIKSEHPCETCSHKNCITNCPAGALESGQLDLGKCISYRKQAGSSCKATCLARLSCPVGSMHRYTDEQIHHIYSLSMQAIERYY
jgi:epoxyqueuosine reductase